MATDSAEKPWDEGRYVLIAPMGATPQVVTEAMDRLLDYGVLPEKVILISTGFTLPGFRNSQEYQEEITSKVGDLLVYRRKSDGRSYDFDLTNVKLELVQFEDKRVNDIRNAKDHEAFMQVMDRIVKTRGMTSKEIPDDPIDEETDIRLIILVSGGRKTMSSGAHSAMELYGLPVDRVIHVLLDPPEVEEDRGFWFRSDEPICVSSTQTRQSLQSKGITRRSDVNIDVIDIEFLPLSRIFDLDVFKLKRDKIYAAIAKDSAAQQGTSVSICTDRRSLSYRGEEIIYEPQKLAFHACMIYLSSHSNEREPFFLLDDFINPSKREFQITEAIHRMIEPVELDDSERLFISALQLAYANQLECSLVSINGSLAGLSFFQVARCMHEAGFTIKTNKDYSKFLAPESHKNNKAVSEALRRINNSSKIPRMGNIFSQVRTDLLDLDSCILMNEIIPRLGKDKEGVRVKNSRMLALKGSKRLFIDGKEFNVL